MEIIDKTPVIFSKGQYTQYGIENCLVKTEFYCEDESLGGLQLEHVEKAIKNLEGE